VNRGINNGKVVMPSDRMLGFRAKLERAKKHVGDLVAMRDTFFETEPYKIIIEDEAKTGDRVFRVSKVVEVPTEILAAIGDIFHNLRCALDHLAWQLVLANGRTGTPQTAYPIFDTIKIYKARCGAKVNGISSTAIDLINQTKPYKGGNDDLWRLHKLDNIDKHRLLLAVGIICPTMILDFNALAKSQNPKMVGTLPIVPLPTRNQTIIVKDGAEIHRIARFADHPDMYTQPQFPPDIAISELTVGETEPVFRAIEKYFNIVCGIINDFAHLL
jgi:hypothetical protein